MNTNKSRKQKIRLGIVGFSAGNGHPYSWSAICNGFDGESIKTCDFPVIHEYLSKQVYPDNFIQDANVTHIWTQSLELSKHIAASARIPNIVESKEELIGLVDAILLARDDAENHYENSACFLNAGLPIYIDKPLALNQSEALRLFKTRKYANQLFSCSALAYARELLLSQEDHDVLGQIKYVDAVCCNVWPKYAVHIIEPVLRNIPYIGTISNSHTQQIGAIQKLSVIWTSGIVTDFTCYGPEVSGPIEIRYYGENSFKRTTFEDTFNAFKLALVDFLETVKVEIYQPISDEFMLKVVSLIELGTAQ